jgi:hypothetical protein
MQTHMQPIHYYPPSNLDPVIAPRYILKVLSNDCNTTSVSLYYEQNIFSDVPKGTNSCIIQQYICPKSCKPSLYRFEVN